MSRPKTIPKACRNRHHSYPDDAAGAVCTGCGKVRGGPRALGVDGAAGLRVALGIETKDGERAGLPVAAVAMEPPGAGAAVPPLPPAGPAAIKRSIWPRVARRLTQVFDAGTDWAIERAGRSPHAAEQDDLDDFEEGLGAQLAIWFPDVALSPLVQVAMAGTFIVAEKAWNAPKLPTKEVKVAAPAPELPPATDTPPPPPTANGAPAAGTTSEAAMLLDLQI